jgi:alpha-L-fucosidase
MEKPEGDIHISSLGLNAETARKVKSVKLLGSAEKIKWTQTGDEVRITRPTNLPDYNTLVFAIQ